MTFVARGRKRWADIYREEVRPPGCTWLEPRWVVDIYETNANGFPMIVRTTIANHTWGEAMKYAHGKLRAMEGGGW